MNERGKRKRVKKLTSFFCRPPEARNTNNNASCLIDDKLETNGSTWWKDECTSCTCDEGQIYCTITPQCPELPPTCTVTRIPPKQCCPVCVLDGAADNTPTHPDGCITSGGKMLQNGHSWHEDPCTPCVCQGGHKKCQAYMCEVSCVNPTYVPDDCCPLCDSTSVILFPPHCPTLNNCSLRCVHGFVRNDAGCFMCQCQADTHGNKLCECAEKALPPFLDCPPLVDCHKNCSHGFRVNKAGCPVCKCSQCRTTGDCHKNCIHGLRTNDRGCTICKCRGESHLIATVVVI
uniref:VWFC domain-containing protein n=1 Tax=Timema shepardi TaxID=629360 RepID=A0A7R9AXE6_TIMSH|nr:unnamed protein product [Timema shepardi]